MGEYIKPQPIVKWAGGKRQLINTLFQYLPQQEFKTYYEPFFGGGAMLFALLPKKAVINDYNKELINMYNVIRWFPQELVKKLEEHAKKHDKDYFYTIRSLDRDESYKDIGEIEKAARTIYLNRTCYNGLYRVSKKGYFNTPIGKGKNISIVNDSNILAVHEYLEKSNIQIKCGDYKEALTTVERNDFVYLDPPYDPVSVTSSFTSYTDVGFGKEAQIQLKKECDRLNNLGAFFMQSNSDTEFIRDLYKDYKIIPVYANRSINSNSKSRKEAKEIIIINY